MTILGDEFTEDIGRNFLKVADELILVDRDGQIDEFFEGFFKAKEGNPSLMKHADDVAVKVGGSAEPLSPQAKAALKQFLSDPDAGSLWKIDVPVIIDHEPAIPHNYWVRGLLGELAVFKRQYKAAGYQHAPTAPGYDFTGPAWVQIKTVANPANATQRMNTAIDALITHSPGAPTPLKLHILKKPGTASGDLETALANYMQTLPPANRDRIEVIIEAFELSQ